MGVRRSPWLAALALALLALGSIGDVLIADGEVVVSHAKADTGYYFARVRRFAAAEMLNGNLPLWNPHVFSGQPFLGSLQPTLLYPPNATHLILPLHWAINLEVVLHVFLLGLFTFAWARGRGLGLLAAWYTGAVTMLCGAVSLRVLAGQLTVLTAACWTPLVLLAADRLLARPSLGWALAGVAAFTLQLLAGYPFYAYVSGLILLLTVPARLVRAPRPVAPTVALAAMAMAPPFLAAAQLLPGFETAAESTRGGGVPLWFAASFSLPPWNLVTTVAPAFFGDLVGTEYWGLWAYWDAAAFLGTTTVVLAGYGLLRGAPSVRVYAAPLALLMLVLALGTHTPVYGFLFEHVPGFGSFRAPSKFALHFSLFVALLAGAGLDRLIRERAAARAGLVIAAVVALSLAIAAAWIRLEAATPDAGAWGEFALRVANPNRTPAAEEVALLGGLAARSLLVAAVTAVAAAVLFALAPRLRAAVLGLALLGVAEVFAFAATHHDRFALDEIARPDVERFHRAHPGEHRVLDVEGRNHAMDAGALAVWGYDPVQLERYARFAASVQMFARSRAVVAPDSPLPIVPKLTDYHPVLRLVRCRFEIPDWSLSIQPVEFEEEPLPRVLLVGQAWLVPPDRVLRSLFDPEFDPFRSAIVEEPPDPLPTDHGATGSTRVVEESTDHLVVEAELPAPALLVVTDAYSTGWRATSEREDPPRELRVFPVDSVLRGVALPAGRHRVRLEYAPASWRVGAWISSLSLVGFVAALSWWALSPARRPEVTAPGP